MTRNQKKSMNLYVEPVSTAGTHQANAVSSALWRQVDLSSVTLISDIFWIRNSYKSSVQTLQSAASFTVYISALIKPSSVGFSRL